MSTATPVRPDASDSDSESGPMAAPTIPTGRGGGRRMATAIIVVVFVVAGVGFLAAQGGGRGPRHTVAVPPVPLAVAFLSRYAAPDGRVVRFDQGGDTVSEGQAYGMLLAVAADDAAEFASVWNWERTYLQLPDGLFAYHWADGRVVDGSPATDADLETAWALVLGAKRFGIASYRAEGLQIAAAILDEETVVAGGRLELVAGPWARTAPYWVDPSYLAPEAVTALAVASGDRRWDRLAADSLQLISELEGGRSGPRRLPPDWARLSPSGALTPSGPPLGSEPPAYGLDAQRIVVWEAAACSASGRALAARDWPLLSRAADGGANVSYALDGTVLDGARNELGEVAVAAAADAAGARRQGAVSLQAAESRDHGHNYYGDAWSALGSVLLNTSTLGSCPPAPER